MTDHKKYTAYSLTILMVFLMAHFSYSSSNSQTNIATLRGIKGMTIEVEDLNPMIVKSGLTLTKDQIKTDFESKLNQAGIAILSQQEALDKNSPYLDVSLNAFSPVNLESGSLWVFNITISLNQLVSLSSNQNILVTVPTWTISRLGMLGDVKLNEIRDPLKSMMDEFIADYLTVNPRGK